MFEDLEKELLKLKKENQELLNKISDLEIKNTILKNNAEKLAKEVIYNSLYNSLEVIYNSLYNSLNDISKI